MLNMSYGGSSSGSSRIATSADAALSSLANGDVLTYDSTTQKWKNAAIPTSTASVADGSITSAKIADGTIVDADVSSTAAIAQAKVSGLTTSLAAKLGRPLQTTVSATIAAGTAPTFIIRS